MGWKLYHFNRVGKDKGIEDGGAGEIIIIMREYNTQYLSYSGIYFNNSTNSLSVILFCSDLSYMLKR